MHFLTYLADNVIVFSEDIGDTEKTITLSARYALFLLLPSSGDRSIQRSRCKLPTALETVPSTLGDITLPV